MNRQDIIEKMAATMYEQKFKHEWKWSGSYRKKYLKRAEAALDAVLKELPEITRVMEISEVIWGGIINPDTPITAKDNALELYQELLTMRKK